MNIRESDLPGIGRKVQLETRGNDQLVLILHDDGRREVYHFEQDNLEEAISTVTLNDEEARLVAAILGGLSYRPKALENIQSSLQDLIIDWYKLKPEAKCIGKTIGELTIRQKTGANIIAIIEKEQNKVSPGPDHVLVADSTLVVAGERQHIKKLKEILLNGE